MSSVTIHGNTYDDVQAVNYVDKSGNQHALKRLVLNGNEIWTAPIQSILDPILENNSWEDIVRASKAGVACNTWSIGDTKTLTFYDENYSSNMTENVRIIGFNHDDLSENDIYYNDSSYNNGSNKAGITFEFEKLHFSGQIHSVTPNESGWAGCDLRNSVLPVFKSNIVDNVKNNIRMVKKSTILNNVASYTDDEIFILSYTELGGYEEYDGTQYTPYTNDDSSRIKYYCDHWDLNTAGNPSQYWTRTLLGSRLYPGRSNYIVGEVGNLGNSYALTATMPYAPAFCV